MSAVQAAREEARVGTPADRNQRVRAEKAEAQLAELEAFHNAWWSTVGKTIDRLFDELDRERRKVRELLDERDRRSEFEMLRVRSVGDQIGAAVRRLIR